METGSGKTWLVAGIAGMFGAVLTGLLNLVLAPSTGRIEHDLNTLRADLQTAMQEVKQPIADLREDINKIDRKTEFVMIDPDGRVTLDVNDLWLSNSGGAETIMLSGQLASIRLLDDELRDRVVLTAGDGTVTVSGPIGTKAQLRGTQLLAGLFLADATGGKAEFFTAPLSEVTELIVKDGTGGSRIVLKHHVENDLSAVAVNDADGKLVGGLTVGTGDARLRGLVVQKSGTDPALYVIDSNGTASFVR